MLKRGKDIQIVQNICERSGLTFMFKSIGIFSSTVLRIVNKDIIFAYFLKISYFTMCSWLLQSIVRSIAI